MLLLNDKLQDCTERTEKNVSAHTWLTDMELLSKAFFTEHKICGRAQVTAEDCITF